MNDKPSRRAAFQVAPMLSDTPCSASSQAWAWASVIPGRDRMRDASAISWAGLSLRAR